MADNNWFIRRAGMHLAGEVVHGRTDNGPKDGAHCLVRYSASYYYLLIDELWQRPD